MNPNQCRFCGSRKCYTRIYTTADSSFDEVACRKHSPDLHKYSDAVLGTNNGVMRMYVASSEPQFRGDVKKTAKEFNREIEKIYAGASQS